MDRRRCLACGHAGRKLQGRHAERTFVCPACGADLYARPARAYADLEGFSAPPSRPPGHALLRALASLLVRKPAPVPPAPPGVPAPPPLRPAHTPEPTDPVR
jgi:predicted RNA-binding Zn-ribbon protein involved in translation (DUF1610 family)